MLTLLSGVAGSTRPTPSNAARHPIASQRPGELGTARRQRSSFSAAGPEHLGIPLPTSLRFGGDRHELLLRASSPRHHRGRLHLFDAKLKVDFSGAVAADGADPADARPDTFKREDLYKMHAYRDALGADSVWVLYPGSQETPAEYRVPWPAAGTPPDGGFRGVGAIALRPGEHGDGGLRKRIADIVGVEAASDPGSFSSGT